MRVRGKGVRRKDGTQGDLLVTVDVVVPTTSRGAREALQAYRDGSVDGDPRAELLARAGERRATATAAGEAS